MIITEVTRRDILEYILSRGEEFLGRLDVVSFFLKVFNLRAMKSTDRRFSDAAGDIGQHMINNSDWDYEYLFYSYLDLLNVPDQTFLKFLETVVSPIVNSDTEIRQKYLRHFNQALAQDGFALRQVDSISGKSLYKGVGLDTSENTYKYEILFSYAGENREYVERVANYLKDQGVRIFYDQFEEAEIWGKDLAVFLESIYSRAGRYCIIFISRDYAEKIWTRHEFRSALSKAVREKAEYILPARFDNTELEGLRDTIAYIELSKKSPEDFAQVVLRKLHLDTGIR